MNDATCAIQNMLNTAALGWCKLDFSCRGPIEIDAPLVLPFTRNTQHVYLDFSGTILMSTHTDGASVLTLSVADGDIDVRDVCIDRLAILGNGKEGHGFEVAGPDNTSWLYNFAGRDMVVEGVGGDGFHDEGSFFESFFDNCKPRGCLKWGATLGSKGSGIMSGINWSRGSLRKNGSRDPQTNAAIGGGMQFVNGANDIGVDRAYFVENIGPGLWAPNGLGDCYRSQFENNVGFGIVAGQWGIIKSCTSGGNAGTQQGLLQISLNDRLVLSANSYGNASIVTGQGVVEIDGSANGLTVTGPQMMCMKAA